MGPKARGSWEQEPTRIWGSCQQLWQAGIERLSLRKLL